MIPLIQRRNECSLASICTLNGCTQKDYEAVSDLARVAGARYAKLTGPIWTSIQIGVQICRDLGLYVPESYPLHCSYDRGKVNPDFSGKGIARIAFLPKRCRIRRAHVVAFEDGRFADSDGIVYSDLDHMIASYHKEGHRKVEVTQIFK